MAAVQVAGLGPDELARALAYEVEPFSGVPASEAEVAFEPVAGPDPAVRVYDVVVTRRGGGGGPFAAARLVKPLAIAGVLLLLAAAADFFMLSRRLDALDGARRRRSALQAQIDALARPAAAARAEAQAVRTRRAAALRAQEDVASRRAALGAVLRAVAEACGDKAVLTSLDGAADSVKVRCVAASAAAASDATVAMTASLASLGWRLVPGALAVRAPGMTAEFECEARHD